jgi:hypothetical protein
MVQVMPDCLLKLIQYLDASTDLMMVDEISRDLTGFEAGMTWMTVTEAPGQEIIPGILVEPSFDINIYAPTIGEAKRISRIAHAVVLKFRGYKDSDIVVSKVTVAPTPYDLTDLLNNSPRYVFSAAIRCRPN